MRTKKITIKGTVHDVGYRLFLLSEAEGLLIEKFDAKNILRGGEQHLIVLIGGDENAVNKFVAVAKSDYPPNTMVKSVEVEDYEGDVRSAEAFRNFFMLSQTAKIAQVGVSMLEKQDVMIEKQDQGREEIVAEIKSLRGDLRDYMNTKFAMLEKDIKIIKSKIGLF